MSEKINDLKNQIASLEKRKIAILNGEPVEYRKADLYIKKNASIKELDEAINFLGSKVRLLEKKNNNIPFKVLGNIE